MAERKHNHAEAFALMIYQCSSCGHTERIWNSRDGVTPFCMLCPSCGDASLTHVMWKQDEYAPNHKLHPGQRFWRDGTPDEAEKIMRSRIENTRNTYPLSAADEQRYIQAARNGEGEFFAGWPKLDVNLGKTSNG